MQFPIPSLKFVPVVASILIATVSVLVSVPAIAAEPIRGAHQSESTGATASAEQIDKLQRMVRKMGKQLASMQEKLDLALASQASAQAPSDAAQSVQVQAREQLYANRQALLDAALSATAAQRGMYSDSIRGD